MPRPQVKRSRVKDPEPARPSKSPCIRRSSRLAGKASSVPSSESSSLILSDLPVPRRASLFGKEIEPVEDDHSKSFREINLEADEIIISSDSLNEEEGWERGDKQDKQEDKVGAVTKSKGKTTKANSKSNSKSSSRRSSKRIAAQSSTHHTTHNPATNITPTPVTTPTPHSPTKSHEMLVLEESPIPTYGPITSKPTESPTIPESSPIYTSRIENKPPIVDSDSDEIYYENAENVPPGEPLSDDPFGFNEIINYRPKLRRNITKIDNEFKIYEDDSLEEETSEKEDIKVEEDVQEVDSKHRPSRRSNILKPLTSEQLISRLPKVLKTQEPQPKKKIGKSEKSTKPKPKPKSKSKSPDSGHRKQIQKITEKYEKIDEWQLNEVIISSSPSSSSSN